MQKTTRLFLLLAGLFSFLPGARAGAADTLEVKVMTFSIRYYRAPNDGRNAWEFRKRMVADLIQDSGADAIGLQEAEFPQVEYLRGRLEDDFGILVTYTLGKHSNALLYPKAPFVLTGDLNSREDNPAILFFKGKKLSIDGQSHKNPVPMVDTFRVKHGEKAEAGTFNGFDPNREFLKIDYIFAERRTEVLDAEIITYSKNGHYPSDHFPVTATLRFR